MKDYNAAIGRWLADKRKAAGRTQLEAAAALGMSNAHLSRMEAGKRTIYADTLIKYCQYLGVDPRLLLDDLEKEPYASL